MQPNLHIGGSCACRPDSRVVQWSAQSRTLRADECSNRRPYRFFQALPNCNDGLKIGCQQVLFFEVAGFARRRRQMRGGDSAGVGEPRLHYTGVQHCGDPVRGLSVSYRARPIKRCGPLQPVRLAI